MFRHLRSQAPRTRSRRISGAVEALNAANSPKNWAVSLDHLPPTSAARTTRRAFHRLRAARDKFALSCGGLCAMRPPCTSKTSKNTKKTDGKHVDFSKFFFVHVGARSTAGANQQKMRSMFNLNKKQGTHRIKATIATTKSSAQMARGRKIQKNSTHANLLPSRTLEEQNVRRWFLSSWFCGLSRLNPPLVSSPSSSVRHVLDRFGDPCVLLFEHG